MESVNHSFCALEVKKSDYYRYLCCLFIPEDMRWRVFSIYAFNSEIAKIKDIVSEPMMGHIRLQWWRDAIEEIYSNPPAKHKHQISEELYRLVSQGSIPKNLFEDLIEVREAELEFTALQNMQAIEQHAKSTTTTLFKLLLAAMDFSDIKNFEQTIDYAAISYSLVGILRAAKHDAHHRRVMFPQDFMDKNGINSEDVIEGRKLEKTIPIAKALCEIAKLNFDKATDGLRSLPKQYQPIFLPLAVVPIFLKRIEKNGYDIFRNDLETGKFSLQFGILKSAIFGI